MTGPELCLIFALFYESGTESDAGLIATGTVILNRVDSPKYPNDICGVVMQKHQFTFYWDGLEERPDTSAKNYKRAERAAREVLQGVRYDFDGVATNYVNLYLAAPEWVGRMRFLEKIGRHWFYDENG